MAIAVEIYSVEGDKGRLSVGSSPRPALADNTYFTAVLFAACAARRREGQQSPRQFAVEAVLDGARMAERQYVAAVANSVVRRAAEVHVTARGAVTHLVQLTHPSLADCCVGGLCFDVLEPAEDPVAGGLAGEEVRSFPPPVAQRRPYSIACAMHSRCSSRSPGHYTAEVRAARQLGDQAWSRPELLELHGGSAGEPPPQPPAKARLGLGRIVALHYPSPTAYDIREHIRHRSF
jgi:hypothetical protein